MWRQDGASNVWVAYEIKKEIIESERRTGRFCRLSFALAYAVRLRVSRCIMDRFNANGMVDV